MGGRGARSRGSSSERCRSLAHELGLRSSWPFERSLEMSGSPLACSLMSPVFLLFLSQQALFFCMFPKPVVKLLAPVFFFDQALGAWVADRCRAEHVRMAMGRCFKGRHIIGFRFFL